MRFFIASFFTLLLSFSVYGFDSNSLDVGFYFMQDDIGMLESRFGFDFKKSSSVNYHINLSGAIAAIPLPRTQGDGEYIDIPDSFVSFGITGGISYHIKGELFSVGFYGTTGLNLLITKDNVDDSENYKTLIIDTLAEARLFIKSFYIGLGTGISFIVASNERDGFKEITENGVETKKPYSREKITPKGRIFIGFEF
ncbi:hypothetical protein JXR93_04165 [bacterium]|nr:hypothetical protein [bacterium]